MTGFGSLLKDLNEAGVPYVVVGGIAVIRHGVVRATKDLAVVVAPDDATEAALGELMGRWGRPALTVQERIGGSRRPDGRCTSAPSMA